MTVIKRERAAHRLSALEIRKAVGPCKLEDGEGLRLLVDEVGNKRWVVRITIGGRRANKGLGSLSTVPLAMAREKAAAMRKAARQGVDLAKERRDAQRAVVEAAAPKMTFQEAFEVYYADKKLQLKDGRYRLEWPRSMRQHVYPYIGDRPVADITPPEIIELLRPIWNSRPETGRKIRQRVHAVFEAAIVVGKRLAASPCVGVSQVLGKSRPRAGHRPSMPYAQVAAFFDRMPTLPSTPATKLALNFILFTCCRSLEVRGAQWSEVDMTASEWTVPSCRMKGKVAHVVPLSSGALAILRDARALRVGDCGLVFPGGTGKILSDNTLSKMMRDAKFRGKATPHGFRTSFKNWAAENGVEDHVSECVLAHTDEDPVRGAYRRTTRVDDRRLAMQRWSDVVVGKVKLETKHFTTTDALAGLPASDP